MSEKSRRELLYEAVTNRTLRLQKSKNVIKFKEEVLFLLDCLRVLTEIVGPGPQPGEITYKVGDHFLCEGHEFILAEIKLGHVAMVGLTDGQLYGMEPVRVVNVEKIKQYEFDEVCGARKGRFKRCEDIGWVKET